MILGNTYKAIQLLLGLKTLKGEDEWMNRAKARHPGGENRKRSAQAYRLTRDEKECWGGGNERER